MKAVIYTEYGSPDVLHLAEVAKPAPQDNEVLIRVHATAVNFGDLMARNFKSITPRKFGMPLPLMLISRMYFGFSEPKVNILGSEFAGVVEAVGAQVTRFKPGMPSSAIARRRWALMRNTCACPKAGCWRSSRRA